MKYNIIGNGCFSSCLTKNLLKQEYVNPFIWSLLNFKSMYNIISLYDTLNFDNYCLVYNELENNYTIKIDDKVDVVYLHYRYDANATKYTIVGSDGFYCDMENFLKEKYEKHIGLMKKYEPIFLVAQTNSINYYTDYELREISKIETRHPVFISEKKLGNTETSKYFYEKLKENKVIIH